MPITTASETYETKEHAESSYLTKEKADKIYVDYTEALNIYLSQYDATQTYLSKADAASTYLSIENAGATYLSKSDATSNYLSKTDAASSYLTIKNADDKFITKKDIGDKYATKTDPILNGMLSLNRLSQSPSGYNSSTLGYNCTAFGDDTLASGKNTIANGRSQHVFGEYNIADENTSSGTRSKNAVIVGNGTDGARSNAHTLDWNGNAEYAGDIKANACGGETPISLKETNDIAVEDKTRIDTLETLGLVLLDGTINATFEVEDPEPAEISEDEDYYPYNNF